MTLPLYFWNTQGWLLVEIILILHESRFLFFLLLTSSKLCTLPSFKGCLIFKSDCSLTHKYSPWFGIKPFLTDSDARPNFRTHPSWKYIRSYFLKVEIIRFFTLDFLPHSHRNCRHLLNDVGLLRDRKVSFIPKFSGPNVTSTNLLLQSYTIFLTLCVFWLKLIEIIDLRDRKLSN